MTGHGGARARAVGYSDLLAHRRYLVLLGATTLSTWGDYVARISVAAVVYQQTGSPLATAVTLAVSLVPVVLGRSVLAAVADRLPYRDVLVASHLTRAVLVLVLLSLILSDQSLGAVLFVLFLVEFCGGPATTAYQQLLTDLFPDRRLYAKAFGLGVVAEQVNQAIGLIVGGALVVWIGPTATLLFDVASFLVIALAVVVVISRREPGAAPAPGVHGAVAGLGDALRQVLGSRVQTTLLGLSLVSALAMAAPEAVAIPYASAHEGGEYWSGVLMASPVVGAVLGLLLIGRHRPEVQSTRILPMALVMPLPLLVTLLEPPLLVVAAAWFACGVLQAFMLPLQSTFTLMVPRELRGRVFGLAGALSVGVTGVFFVLAGWLSTHTTTQTAVGICAIITFGGTVLMASTWPRQELAAAVSTAFRVEMQDGGPEGEAAATDPPGPAPAAVVDDAWAPETTATPRRPPAN